ncbi:cyclic nucleotide-binding protein (plasmid) [Microvirga sp. RSM25]|uniref:CBU_0592 family membrane protein n=1 Tax=Microvirga sp. RSM25 TaxID=3273802 RepID=UPI00384AC947
MRLTEVWSSTEQAGTFMSIADFVGLIGVAAYLLAYGLLQLDLLKVEDDRYASLNGIGAIAILYSLIFDFNLPSFIAQAAWLVFTIIGYVRSHSKRTLSKTVNT